ncbi:MAG: stage sporulation protein [Halanaerobiales bacterium]|nr:stage sporulation protein [Halanaerobiales bacterium]
MLGRKFIWLMILMVWVGMVTSIIIYQGKDYLTLEKTTSGNVEIIEEEPVVELKENNPIDINFTQAREEEQREDFFIESKLERDKYRSEQISNYREIINNPKYSEEAKKEAQQKILQLTEEIEKAMEIESLIRARGYKDAIAFIHDNAVDVVIETNGLDKSDVARIGDIIHKVTGFNFEDVTIIEKRIEKGE